MKLCLFLFPIVLFFPFMIYNDWPSYQSAFGEYLTVQPTAIVQLQFPYGNLNSNYVLATGANGGSVTNSSNFALLSTGTGATGVALMRSKVRLHYQPGQGCESLFTALFTAGVSGSSQQIGLGNLSVGETGATAGTPIQDGFFFGYFNGTSVSYTGLAGASYAGNTFGIIHTIDTMTTFYPQTSWNVDTMLGGGGSSNPSGLTLDQTKGNVYKIQYQWLGFGLIGFFIENQDTGSVNLVHTISYSNQNTKTTLLNPALQLMAKVEKTSGATDITLKNPSFAGIVQGIPNSNQDQRLSIAMTGAAFSVPTSNINHILSIQNNGVFNSLPNQVEVFPDWLSILNTGSSSAEAMFGIYLNATPSTTLSYNFVNQSSSVVSYSTTTATLSSGTLLATFYINGIDSGETILISLSDFKFQLEPGDVLSISGTTINGNQTTEARVSIGWHEAF